MYDIIVIGAGPAGLTAGIYAGRAGFSVVIIEKMAAGGQVNFAAELENYPALDNVSGEELAMKMKEQAIKYGAEFLSDEVLNLDVTGDTKKIQTAFNGTIEGKNVILAMGTKNRELGIENEAKFIGSGISYCAVCDGAFFRKKTVAVAGGGNTAFKDVLYLSKFVDKIYLIHRREGFRADKIMVDRAKADKKVEFVLNATVEKLIGENMLTGIVVKNKSGEETTLNVNGLFVAVGNNPETELIKGIVETDEYGYIITDEDMKTNIGGVFAAGDIRQKSLRQIITACSDGAIAVNSAMKNLT